MFMARSLWLSLTTDSPEALSYVTFENVYGIIECGRWVSFGVKRCRGLYSEKDTPVDVRQCGKGATKGLNV